jgi:hypothetical protein
MDRIREHQLKGSKPGSEGQKPRFLSYVEYRPNTNTAILMLQGGHIQEGEGKRRKLRK